MGPAQLEKREICEEEKGRLSVETMGHTLGKTNGLHAKAGRKGGKEMLGFYSTGVANLFRLPNKVAWSILSSNPV